MYGLIEMNSFVYIVTYWNQLEVAPLKNLPSTLEIRREGSLWIQQRNWNHGKNLRYNIKLLYINIA